jgi:hypothetical protein
MKPSKLFNLNAHDFVKGLILALLTAIVTFLTDFAATGAVIDLNTLKKVAVAAAIAMISYLIKNLFTNSADQVAKPENAPLKLPADNLFPDGNIGIGT